MTDQQTDQPTDEVFDLGAFLAELQKLGAHNAERVAQGEAPEAFAVGTFAVYPTANGGLHLVVDAPAAGGVRRMEMQPGMIRALSAFAGGTGKLGAFLGRRRRRELPAADGQ